MLKKINWIFICFFGYLIFIYKNAFTINFFQDDYFFLKISRAKNIADFLHFFSPFHEYFYRPLATEVFYFILHLLKENVFIGHFIVFTVYFIGLIFLYKIVKLLINDLTAKLTVFLYGISFIHVFQIYWFATFQEVAVFTFLCVSFYSFLKNKYLLSTIFFIFALLCKETAALYAPFLILFVIVLKKDKIKKLPIFLITVFIFWLLYRYSLSFVTALDNYKMVWNSKLLLNNSIWYLLWGIGLPNFLPDYFRSIFSKPIATFWEILKIPYSKIYLFLLFIYLLLLFIGLIYLLYKQKNKKKFFLTVLYCLISFFIFLGPILFFRHKWMIRLTMPFVFIAIIEGSLIYCLLTNKKKLINYLGMFLLIIYCVWNFFGVTVHEISSTYFLENNIYIKTQKYFKKNRGKILKYNIIYLKDTSYNLPKGWNGSEKLLNSYSGENFINHFLPEKKIKVIFGYQDNKIPENAYIINSQELLP